MKTEPFFSEKWRHQSRQMTATLQQMDSCVSTAGDPSNEGSDSIKKNWCACTRQQFENNAVFCIQNWRYFCITCRMILVFLPSRETSLSRNKSTSKHDWITTLLWYTTHHLQYNLWNNSLLYLSYKGYKSENNTIINSQHCTHKNRNVKIVGGKNSVHFSVRHNSGLFHWGGGGSSWHLF